VFDVDESAKPGVSSLPAADRRSRLRAACAKLARLFVPRSANEQAATGQDELEHLHDIHWRIADSARRYRELLDAQAGLIVRRAPDGRVTFASRAYLEAFGVSESEIAGRRHEPRVLATLDPGLSAAPERILERVETVKGPRWIEWEQSVCGTAADGGTETQRTGRDVTEERRVAEELKAAHDAALEASRAKSRFLAAMSHEIRTPMNGILGMSGLLLESRLDADQTTYAHAIGQSARSLMTLIDEILDFSRIEAGKLVLSNATFSMVETVESCIALLAPRALEKGLGLSFESEGDVPAHVVGDEPRVRQILLNLLSNAVKFTDSGAVTIVLSATRGEPVTGAVRVRVAVTDTGIGLAAEDRDAVFAEFEQTEAAVRRQDGGSGLGLAIARRIARAMDGDITVASEPGRGSTFTTEIVLGAARPAAGAAPAVTDEASRAPSSDLKTAGVRGGEVRRILLAEDNAINALLATRLLEREGCLVERVHSGDEAVAAIARSMAGEAPAYDLILMDIYMPRLDGIEATRAIRRLSASAGGERLPIPIIAVTANAFVEDRQRYLMAGLDDYLAKPFDARDLQAILARWLPPPRVAASPAA